MNKLQTALNHIKAGNTSYVVNRIAKKIFPQPNPVFFWGHTVFMKGMFVEKQIPNRKNGKPLKVRIASEQDINNLLEQFSYHIYNKARVGNETCFVVIDERTGKVVAYSWIKMYTKPFPTNTGMMLEFKESKVAWGHGFYICPEYRLSNAFLLLTQIMRTFCLDNECEMIYGETNRGNNQSINSFGRLGKRVYETVTFFSLYKLKVYFIQSTLNNKLRIQFRWTDNTHQVTTIRDA